MSSGDAALPKSAAVNVDALKLAQDLVKKSHFDDVIKMATDLMTTPKNRSETVRMVLDHQGMVYRIITVGPAPDWQLQKTGDLTYTCKYLGVGVCISLEGECFAKEIQSSCSTASGLTVSTSGDTESWGYLKFHQDLAWCNGPDEHQHLYVSVRRGASQKGYQFPFPIDPFPNPLLHKETQSQFKALLTVEKKFIGHFDESLWVDFMFPLVAKCEFVPAAAFEKELTKFVDEKLRTFVDGDRKAATATVLHGSCDVTRDYVRRKWNELADQQKALILRELSVYLLPVV